MPGRPAVRIVKGETTITSVNQWGDLAPPRSPDQWVKNRSAMTCAEEWIQHRGTGGPPEILQLLGSHDAFSEVVLDEAEPEAWLVFDERAGSARATDLAVRAHDRHGHVAVAVEAKADEPFAETLSQALVAGLEARVKNPRSAKLARVDEIARTLFACRERGDPSLGTLRYQLMTACVGALALAKTIKATRALVLIHEYVTPATVDPKHDANAADLRKFILRLSRRRIADCHPNNIVGPIEIPGKPLFPEHVPLYIGKAVLCRRRPGGSRSSTRDQWC